jgi:arginase family enzyme
MTISSSNAEESTPMNLAVRVFPFDQFGGAGTSHGAMALADIVREIRRDSQQEHQPCRTQSLRGRLHIHEVAFTQPRSLRHWRERGRRWFRQTLQRYPFILWLGGNHLSILPVLEQLPPQTLILQFDAHLDIHHFDDTLDTLSHGNYWRFLPEPRPPVLHLGHRDLYVLPEETRRFFTAVYSAIDIATRLPEVTAELHRHVLQASRVWIDIDVDVFDPSVCPAVQQPLPFGLTTTTFWSLWQAAWSDKVLGVSVSEFDPGRDVRDQSLHMLGWFIEHLLLQAAQRQPISTTLSDPSRQDKVCHDDR